MVIDVIIGLVVLVAVYVGYRRGMVQPLLAELGFFGALLLIVRHRHDYAAAMAKYLHANPVFDVFGALIIALAAGYLGGMIGGAIHRMPVVRGADGFLGVFVHAAVALAALYVLISALVVMDRGFAPALGSAPLSAAQVAALKWQLGSNPVTSGLVESRDFARLEQQARTPGGAKITESPQLNQLNGVYQDFLEPQLAGSRLAAPVLSFGHRVPGLGKVGPQDLPRPTPRPVAPPRPSASPAPRA